MSDEQATQPTSGRIRLTSIQRRVLGVLIEKGLTTPEYYPLTLKAVVAGCNQRSNREPLASYDEDEVEECLRALKGLGLVECLFPSSGRTERWRQELGRRWELDGTSLGVLGELLLRGAQSEGELRSRASRMRPVSDLDALREILERLRRRSPPLVSRLTAEGVQRGVRWTHALDTDAERERLLAAEGVSGVAREVPAGPITRPRSVGGSGAVVAGASDPASRSDLVARVEELERRVEQLERQRDSRQ